MKLKNRIAKDFKSIQKSANTLFSYSTTQIGKKIEAANRETIAMTAAFLSHLGDPITYQALAMNQTLDRLQHVLNVRYQNLAMEIEDDWGNARQNFDILSRMAAGFIGKKSAPPWRKTVINLKDQLSTDGRFDPRKGHIRMYFRRMVEMIINQIQQGAVQKESLSKILKRVRSLFNRRDAMGVREARHPLNFEYSSGFDEDTGEWNEDVYGPIDISEGTYTLEDVQRFRQQLNDANDWSYREYKPWFSDALKRNNKYLRMLEQMLMADAADQLHSGLLQIGSEEMGIEDMQWVASIDATTCEYCRSRDGMTVTEIKDEIKDEYGDDPPPLHPHCSCTLVPKLKDDWSDNELQKSGMDWDQEDGVVYKASKQEKEYGINDMTFDEYLDLVGG